MMVEIAGAPPRYYFTLHHGEWLMIWVTQGGWTMDHVMTDLCPVMLSQNTTSPSCDLVMTQAWASALDLLPMHT